MADSSARLSCLHTPVETLTSPRRRKVRSTPFPPCGENCVRSLAPPLKIKPAALGFDFVFGESAKSAERLFRLAAKISYAPLLLLSKSNPLCWASILHLGRAQSPLNDLSALRQKFRTRHNSCEKSYPGHCFFYILCCAA